MVKDVLFYVLLIIGMVMFSGCQDDPVNTVFGEGDIDTGIIKTDTIYNIKYGNFYVDTSVISTVAQEEMVFMNKVGMKTRLIFQVDKTSSNIQHEEGRIYLKSTYFKGDDFGEINCPVYALTDNVNTISNTDSKWKDYKSNIDLDHEIGYLKMSSNDSLADTLFFTDMKIFDDQSNDPLINYAGLLVDLPEMEQPFIKKYSGFNSTQGPLFFTTFYDTANASTKLDSITSKLVYNWFIIDDQTTFDEDNFYYLKTFTPTRLEIIPPMDSLNSVFDGELINILSARFYLPIDVQNSYFENDFFEKISVFFPNDSIPPTPSASYNNITINVGINAWETDSLYLRTTLKDDEQQLGNVLLQQGMKFDDAPKKWLIIPDKLGRIYEALAIPKSGRKPYMILTYYKRPQTRF